MVRRGFPDRLSLILVGLGRWAIVRHQGCVENGQAAGCRLRTGCLLSVLSRQLLLSSQRHFAMVRQLCTEELNRSRSGLLFVAVETDVLSQSSHCPCVRQKGQTQMKTKVLSWEATVALGLCLASLVLYFIHFACFRDLQYIWLSSLTNLAFLPISATIPARPARTAGSQSWAVLNCPSEIS